MYEGVLALDGESKHLALDFSKPPGGSVFTVDFSTPPGGSVLTDFLFDPRMSWAREWKGDN